MKLCFSYVQFNLFGVGTWDSPTPDSAEKKLKLNLIQSFIYFEKRIKISSIAIYKSFIYLPIL